MLATLLSALVVVGVCACDNESGQDDDVYPPFEIVKTENHKSLQDVEILMHGDDLRFVIKPNQQRGNVYFFTPSSESFVMTSFDFDSSMARLDVHFESKTGKKAVLESIVYATSSPENYFGFFEVDADESVRVDFLTPEEINKLSQENKGSKIDATLSIAWINEFFSENKSDLRFMEEKDASCKMYSGPPLSIDCELSTALSCLRKQLKEMAGGTSA